jgi:hypothetical protein
MATSAAAGLERGNYSRSIPIVVGRRKKEVDGSI